MFTALGYETLPYALNSPYFSTTNNYFFCTSGSFLTPKSNKAFPGIKLLKFYRTDINNFADRWQKYTDVQTFSKFINSGIKVYSFSEKRKVIKLLIAYNLMIETDGSALALLLLVNIGSRIEMQLQRII